MAGLLTLPKHCVNLEALCKLGLNNAELYDNQGNLHAKIKDGELILDFLPNAKDLSLSKAAHLNQAHYYQVFNKPNGWHYWKIKFNGEFLSLNKFREAAIVRAELALADMIEDLLK